jgi:hypothetical membrane protein
MEEIRSRWPLWGAIAGIIGSLEFAVMWTLAVTVDGHWIIGSMTLSELGGDRPGRWFFNIGVIVAGVLFAILIVGLERTLPRGLLTRIGASLSFAGSAFLVAIGVFPITTGDPHTIASWGFFVLMLVGMLLMARGIRHYGGLGIIAAIITVGVVVLGASLLIISSIPVAEAATVIALISWGFLLSIRLLMLQLLRRTSR